MNIPTLYRVCAFHSPVAHNDTDTYEIVDHNIYATADEAACAIKIMQLDPQRRPAVWSTTEVKAAYHIGERCGCGSCLCCQLRHQIREQDINLIPQYPNTRISVRERLAVRRATQ